MIVTHGELGGAIGVVSLDDGIGGLEVPVSHLILLLAVNLEVVGGDVLLELVVRVIGLSWVASPIDEEEGQGEASCANSTGGHQDFFGLEIGRAHV